jgi:hypothetical protein
MNRQDEGRRDDDGDHRPGGDHARRPGPPAPARQGRSGRLDPAEYCPGRSGPPEQQDQIVRRHFEQALECEAGSLRLDGHGLDRAQAP